MRAAVLCAATAAAVALYAFDPAVTAWFPSCPLHAWTGWACPGCGTLRAAHALLHLRIVEAFHDNALAMVIACLSPALAFRRGQAPHTATRWGRAPRSLLVVVLAFGVLRNVPVRPFTWLLP